MYEEEISDLKINNNDEKEIENKVVSDEMPAEIIVVNPTNRINRIYL